jgi:hypothetical protein
MTVRKLVVIIFLVIGMGILLVVGLGIDREGFIGNLIAGTIEIIITVTVIDWLLQRQRKARWQKVRTQIVGALTQHIDNIIDEYQTRFYSPELDLLSIGMKAGPYGVPNAQTAKALRSMVEKMEKAPPPKDPTEKARELHSAIKWDIEQILSILMPRVLAIECDEPELASVLGGFDDAIRRWRNEILVDEEISLGCDQYSSAIETLKAAAEIYEYLLSHSAT